MDSECKARASSGMRCAPAPRKAGALDAAVVSPRLAGYSTVKDGVVVSEPVTEQPPDSA
jgi:hypothetical protein